MKLFVKLQAALALGTTLLLLASLVRGMTIVQVVQAHVAQAGMTVLVHLAQAGTVVQAVQTAAVHQAGIKYVDV